eukprot:13738148-Alexandrium_andersonii.AAC.1
MCIRDRFHALRPSRMHMRSPCEAVCRHKCTPGRNACHASPLQDVCHWMPIDGAGMLSMHVSALAPSQPNTSLRIV